MGIFDFIKHPIDTIGKFVGLPSEKDRKAQQRALNQQIKAYNEQTEISKQELNRAKDAQAVEKRRIQEKQIRSLRRNSSSKGFLGISNEDAKLGESSSLGA